MVDELLLKQRMFSEVVCGGVEDEKESEVSMKGSAMKASMSEMVSLGEKGDGRVGIIIFLAGGCREEVLVIKEEVESVESFGGEAQERRLVFSTGVQCGRGVRLVEGVDVGVSEFRKEELITGG